MRRLGLFAALLLASPLASAQTTLPNKAADQAARRAQSGNLVGHGGPVKAIAAFGPWVLTGSFDYTAMLWTMSGAKPLLRLADHNGAVNAVAFVPNGKRGLTAGDDGIVRLWNLEGGSLIHKFEGHDAGSKIVGLDVSPDGIWAVSAGWDRTARIWNLTTLQPGPVLRDHRGPVNAVAFGHGAVYTGSTDGEVRAFAPIDGTFLRRIHTAGQSVNVLRQLGHPSEKMDSILFGTVDGQSGVIDPTTSKLVHQLPDAERPILAAANGVRYFAIGSGDGRIRVFEKGDWALTHSYTVPFGPVWALAFNAEATIPHDGNSGLYVGGLDDFVSLWHYAPRATFEPVDASQYPRRFQQTGKPDSDTVARGELQFARKCSICHTLTPDRANRAGPTLHEIFGRRIATRPSYPFSEPLKSLDIVWTPETLSKLFELGPDKFTPGSKMPLQVMSEKTDREDLIAFLTIATRDAKPVDGAAAAPQESPKR